MSAGRANVDAISGAAADGLGRASLWSLADRLWRGVSIVPQLPVSKAARGASSQMSKTVVLLPITWHLLWFLRVERCACSTSTNIAVCHCSPSLLVSVTVAGPVAHGVRVSILALCYMPLARGRRLGAWHRRPCACRERLVCEVAISAQLFELAQPCPLRYGRLVLLLLLSRASSIATIHR